MKIKFTRDFYMPKGFTKVISITGTDLYYNTDGDRFSAVGFSGKKAKYDFFYNFKSSDSRQDYIAKWENAIKARAKIMQDRKDARKAPHTLKTGDIMYSSWGYEQTNVDFYQVVKVVGSHSVEIMPIKQSNDTSDMPYDQGRTMPIKDAFIDGKMPMRKVVNSSNRVNIASYATAWLWDGQPKFYSTYA